ncbi:hypothetical protein LB518_19315 [Mesorhizobium sp. BR1-1-16]|uniref:hypothetical protein n=1 Tax=Mesorhizobium sp. BR1-1-16 TaxID=2876653 RepID=UPI001CCECDDC|nr:hypothetical protein [Mesorhizobium sp. BR1-1-16]MBZ9938458.1 hypothetical protein [Mesorhizobium sp. BR1-1-16]
MALLPGCNTWQNYQQSVEKNCRQQAKYKSDRYYDCLRKAAAVDRQRLRHQDEAWLDSLEDASQFPIVPLRPQYRPPYHH